MAEAREMCAWDMVAWVCLHAGTSLFSKRPLKLADFHPIRGRAETVNLGALEQNVAAMSKLLPKSMTAEEELMWWGRLKAGKAKTTTQGRKAG